MCYHLSCSSGQTLKSNSPTGAPGNPQDSLRHSGFDHPDLPASLSTEDDELTQLEWGLIPAWARDLEHARTLQHNGLNARAETMFEKPMFRDAAAHRRCIIWLDGFYEWKHVGKKKIPYFIHLPESQYMAVGGLWSEWRNPANNELFRTCVVVTTEANELMAEIHNTKHRMPLILPEEAREVWLAQDATQPMIEAIAIPFPNGILIADELVEHKKAEEKDTNGLLF